MKQIINIDQDKCVGCGLCANACHQGAIQMVDGKAKLVRDDYCDGLGRCLPVCPTGAISFVDRIMDNTADNGVASDATTQMKSAVANTEKKTPPPGGCPSKMAKELNRQTDDNNNNTNTVLQNMPSRLRQWPVQIQLVPTNAAYFENANLLIAADCAAYAYANFHNDYMKNKVTLIGCPKLDSVEYSDKLTEIIRDNNIKSVTAVRMEVPCCGGIENAVKTALKNSGKFLPWQVVTISIDGKILED